MESDDELKDEELVDFEASDYDIDGDYEEEDFEDENLKESRSRRLSDPGGGERLDSPDAEASSSVTNGALTSERSSLEASQFLIKLNVVEAEVCQTDLQKDKEGATESHGSTGRTSDVGLQNREVTVSAVSSPEKAEITQKLDGGVEERIPESSRPRLQEKGRKNVEKEKSVAGKQRDCNNVAGPSPNELSDASVGRFESEFGEGRSGLSPCSKPDLEDGELEETAVPHSLAEEEIIDQFRGRERKRKAESSDTGKQTDGHSLKHPEEKRDFARKQQHSSFRHNLSALYNTGGRGMGMRMVGLGQASLAPGIMGPGRPVMPIGLARLAQGLSPFVGITQHGRPQVHLQEVLAQQHLVRAHSLQLAPEALATAMRSSLTRPLSALAFQPLVSFDVPGPRSDAPKHLLRPLPDLVMRPMGNFAIGEMSNLPAARAGVPGKAGRQGDTHLFNGVGRQFGWPSIAMSTEALRRGSELQTGLCGNVTESFGHMAKGLGSAGHSRTTINALPRLNIRHAHSDDTVLRQMSSGSLRAENDLLYNKFDVRRKIGKEKMLKNGLPNIRTTENTIVGGNLSVRRESVGHLEKPRELKFPGLQDKRDTVSVSLGLSTQPKVETFVKTDCAEESAASTVIKLHQPVRKSRMLLVSGLPEDIPISMVMEVFEKLGKITDVKKSAKGNAFTVSYSSEMEAVSAKRNLHRTCLAGNQIMIDYAH